MPPDKVAWLVTWSAPICINRISLSWIALLSFVTGATAVCPSDMTRMTDMR